MINVHPDKYRKQGAQLNIMVLLLSANFVGLTIAAFFVQGWEARMLAVVSSGSSAGTLFVLAKYVRELTKSRLQLMRMKNLNAELMMSVPPDKTHPDFQSNRPKGA